MTLISISKQIVVAVSLLSGISIASGKAKSDAAFHNPSLLDLICVPSRDSLLNELISENGWNTVPGNLEIVSDGEIQTYEGTLEAVHLSSSDFPIGYASYFFFWKRNDGVCVSPLAETFPGSPGNAESIMVRSLSKTVDPNVQQIILETRQENYDPYSMDPDTTFRSKVSQTLTFFHFGNKSGIQIIDGWIPIRDSGDGSKRKTAPTELAVKFDTIGAFEISKLSDHLNKSQRKCLGIHRYSLGKDTANLKMTILKDAHQKALNFFKNGSPQKAADILNDAFSQRTQFDSKNIPIANDLGFFLVEAKRFAEGAKILESVLAADPNRTVAHLNLGDAYQGLGRKTEAKKQYQIYVDRMTKAGKAAKIPARVKTILAD